MTDQARLTWALVLSVLLHGLAMSVVTVVRRVEIGAAPRPALLDVDLLQLPKPRLPAPPEAADAPAPPAADAPAPPVLLPERQIVSPSDAGEEKEPESTRLFSNRDNTVAEEMIRRGEPAGGTETQPPPPPPQEVAAARVEPPESAGKPQRDSLGDDTQVAALPQLDQLLPRPGPVLENVLPPIPEPARQRPASKKRPDLLSHGDPWRSLRGGSMDFLPQVRAGDITLLNTKAELFAPFVRRVAMRVFENFIILLRHSADSGTATEEFAAVEAVMDTEGHLVSIHTRRRSVSAAFATDRNLQLACREGFFDRNPPPGAESADGSIHFVFDARVVLSLDRAGRRVPTWALLGAGLL